MVFLVVIILGLIFWPLSLYLANTLPDFVQYAVPTFLLFLSFALFKRQEKFYLLPVLLVPLFEPKLALLPVSITLLEFFWTRTTKQFLVFMLLAIVLLAASWPSFSGQTVFTADHEAQQAVIRKINLYPTVFTARLFQNKVRLYFDKTTNNFFALIDPNNYFFGFHPRQILVDNQNLTKYPFLALPFVILGIYRLGKSKYKKFIVNLAAASVISLTFLSIFDRNDFILWVPTSLIFIHGVSETSRIFGNKTRVLFLIFIVFSLTQLVKLFVESNL